MSHRLLLKIRRYGIRKGIRTWWHSSTKWERDRFVLRSRVALEISLVVLWATLLTTWSNSLWGHEGFASTATFGWILILWILPIQLRGVLQWLVDGLCKVLPVGWVLLKHFRRPVTMVVLPVLAMVFHQVKHEFWILGNLDAGTLVVIWAMLMYTWWPRNFHFDLPSRHIGWYIRIPLGLLKVFPVALLGFLARLAWVANYPVAVFVVLMVTWLYTLWAWGPKLNAIRYPLPQSLVVSLSLARRMAVLYLIPLVVIEVVLVGLTVYTALLMGVSPFFGLLGLAVDYIVFTQWRNKYPETELAWAQALVDMSDAESDNWLFTYDNQFLGVGGVYSILCRQLGEISVVDPSTTRADIVQRTFNLARVEFSVIGAGSRTIWLLYRGAMWPSSAANPYETMTKGRLAVSLFLASLGARVTTAGGHRK